MDEKFQHVYIEICHKETEETVAVEEHSFLTTPLTYLKANKDWFIFIDWRELSELGVPDGLSIEMDDVFLTYEALFGLKMAKKEEKNIRSFFDERLEGEGIKYSLLFDQTDGVWNVNFTLNRLVGFNEEMTLKETLTVIHSLLVNLINWKK